MELVTARPAADVMMGLESPSIGIAVLCQDIVSAPAGGINLVGIIEGLLVSLPYIGRVKAVTLIHSGSARGVLEVSCTVKDSAGRHVSDSLAEMVRFDHDDSSHYFLGNLELRIGDAGVHFFEVYIDGRPAARVPIHVRESR